MSRVVQAVFPKLLALLVFAVFSGCSHVPIWSMVRLSQVDFATTDPAALRAAIKLPKTIATRRRQVIMRVAVKAESLQAAKDFVLTEVTDPADLMPLHQELAVGTVIVAYRVAPHELDRLTKFRAEILRRKRGRRGSLSISIKPSVCRDGDLPPGPVLLSTYLMNSETGSYVTLVRNVDLRMLNAKRDVANAIPKCSGSES